MVYLVYSVCTEYNKEWAGALTSVSKGSTVKEVSNDIILFVGSTM